MEQKVPEEPHFLVPQREKKKKKKKKRKKAQLPAHAAAIAQMTITAHYLHQHFEGLEHSTCSRDSVTLNQRPSKRVSWISNFQPVPNTTSFLSRHLAQEAHKFPFFFFLPFCFFFFFFRSERGRENNYSSSELRARPSKSGQ